MKPTFKTFLIEGRKNRHLPQQEKRTKTDIFRDYADDSNKDNLYVSFTAVNKIGINPLSKYNTPIGIYTYPLTYVLTHHTPKKLPFAGEAPHAWVIEATANVLNLGTYDNLREDTEKAQKYLESIGWENSRIVTLINEAISEAKYSSSNADASRMWNIARLIGKSISQNENKPTRRTQDGDALNSDMIRFNNVLRKVFGYSIIRDDGMGIIHPSEPTQCVFLSKDAFTVKDKLNNKPTPHSGSDKVDMKAIASDPMKVLYHDLGDVEYGDLSEIDNTTSYSTENAVKTYKISPFSGEMDFWRAVRLGTFIDNLVYTKVSDSQLRKLRDIFTKNKLIKNHVVIMIGTYAPDDRHGISNIDEAIVHLLKYSTKCRLIQRIVGDATFKQFAIDSGDFDYGTPGPTKRW